MESDCRKQDEIGEDKAEWRVFSFFFFFPVPSPLLSPSLPFLTQMSNYTFQAFSN